MLKHVRVMLAAFAILAIGVSPLAASEDLVTKANRVLEEMKNHPDFGTFRGTMKNAKGVLVIPRLLKAGFFLGVEGGNGVLLARNEAGEWSYPAFFSLNALSFGLQIGGQAAEVVFVIRNDKGLDAVINDKVKLGLDGSVSAGTYGRGVEGSTTLGLGVDILAFSKSMGAFAGAALEGAVIQERLDFNRKYYRTHIATAHGILVNRTHSNQQADTLRQTLAGY
jgi:lipid-binding SYLF domain-containing protein